MKCIFDVVLILAVAVSLSSTARADKKAGIQQNGSLDAQINVHMDYLIYLPHDYDEQETWPLLLFLHGGGERGDDLELVKMHGPPKLIAAGKHFPFIVVSPQCPKERSWEPLELMVLVDAIVKKYRVDADRIWVTGLSMGGFGSWRLAAYAPQQFAAIVPICGGGETYWAKRFPHLPVWAFHGAKDVGIPVERSQAMVDALRERGGNPKLTIYPEAGHNAWAETYDNPQLYEWLMEQKRCNSE